MPATRTTLRRSVAAAAALPLLIGALAACGYGSEAEKDDKVAPVAKGKKLSADTVKLGYFPQPDPRHRAGRRARRASSRRSWAAPQIKSTTFNAGPVRDRGAQLGLHRHRLIGPSPSINGYAKSKGKNLRIIGGSASGGVKLVVNPEKIKTLDDLKGKKIATPAAGQHPGRGLPQLDRREGLEGRRPERQGRRLRGPHGQQDHPGRLQVRLHRRCVGAGADRVQAGRRGRQGAARRVRPVARQEVRDHEHHRLAEVPQGAPGRRRGACCAAR